MVERMFRLLGTDERLEADDRQSLRGIFGSFRDNERNDSCVKSPLRHVRLPILRAVGQNE